MFITSEVNTELDHLVLCLNIHSREFYLVIYMEGEKKKEEKINWDIYVKNVKYS